MKRCPQCHRLESDDTLSFCRIDGTTLVRDSGNVTHEAGTVRFDSSYDASEIHTSILPQSLTGSTPSRTTAPTTTIERGSSPTVKEGSASSTTEPSLTVGLLQSAPSARSSKVWLAAVAALVVIIGICTAGYFWSKSRRTVVAPTINSIAVMPFINASGNSDAEYLADGITETLINSLSQLPNLSVKARSSVFRYKGKEVDPKTVGSELTVQTILNGRVVQRADDLTLYLSLVDTRTGDQLWGEQYDRKQADVVSLQSEIARDVLSKLKTKLSGDDEQKVAKNYTHNADAYQLYLQGRFFWTKRTIQGIQKSIDYFQKAIEKDPNFALGYAGLSDGYTLLSYYGGMPAAEAFPKARESALKALSIDDSLAESHNALGFISTLADYDYATSEREYRRALELNPNYALSHQNLGVMLFRIGRSSEGMTEIQRALQLEPASIIINRLYGEVLIDSKRYDEALVQLQKTLELEPSFPTTHLSLSALYQLTDKQAASVESYASYLQLSGRTDAAKLARDSFARGGWQSYLSSMSGPSRPAGISSFMAANFYAQLGKTDEAFAELKKSLDNREFQLLYLRVDPRLDSLRNDPRYQELVKQMRFP